MGSLNSCWIMMVWVEITNPGEMATILIFLKWGIMGVKDGIQMGHLSVWTSKSFWMDWISGMNQPNHTSNSYNNSLWWSTIIFVKVRGFSKMVMGKKQYLFSGIPYAKPPVGNRRFEDDNYMSVIYHVWWTWSAILFQISQAREGISMGRGAWWDKNAKHMCPGKVTETL